MTNYLGLAGVVGHEEQLTKKYNALLKAIGSEAMLIQFERFVIDEELNDIIKQTEDNLIENGIKLPY